MECDGGTDFGWVRPAGFVVTDSQRRRNALAALGSGPWRAGLLRPSAVYTRAMETFKYELKALGFVILSA